MATPPFLAGTTLYLRPLQDADADGPYPHWLNDAETCAGNSHHCFPYAREQALNYIRMSRDSRDQLVLAIILLDGERHVGNVALQSLSFVHRSAEFSILIGDGVARGRGVGIEAGRLLVRHGFEALNLHRIGCGTFSNNTAMLALAKRLGMREEGMRREAVFKQGRWLDVVEFGLLRAEFLAQ
ncbi:MAG: GNAT family N-acetyltransferase [Magnetococcales bacterium]|nr:GNAT family N-acetyltransferase [Magnetococcales bacterium]